MSQSQQYTKVQYGGETTYGTETSSYNELFLVQSCNLTSNNNLIQSRGLGEGFNVKKALYGIFSASGDITQDLYDFTFLRHWIGALSGAGTLGDKYTLTEATRVNPSSSATYLQPFSIEKLNDTETSTNAVEVGLGCVGTDFSMTTSIGQTLNFNGNFIVRETKYRSTGETFTDAQQTAYV
ncbi:MAG: phage tail tube protein, partial [Nanoarchaeota archaeon]